MKIKIIGLMLLLIAPASHAESNLNDKNSIFWQSLVSTQKPVHKAISRSAA
ncbi:hypothetical protein [Kistimonas scapharcae]|uniref:hypothetical protein n=1 Tax=Kistimonas scapharcae TaxID=1036133 RepID=UPI0031F0BA83